MIIVCCTAAADIIYLSPKLWHCAVNIIKNYTVKQHLLPALKCFLLEYVRDALVMNINQVLTLV